MAVAELAGGVDQGAVLGLPAACRELYLADADVVSRWVRALAGPSADVEDLAHDAQVPRLHPRLPLRELSTRRGV